MRYRIIFQLMFLAISINTIAQVKDTLSGRKIFIQPKSEHSFDLAFRFPVGAFGDDFQGNAASSSGGVIESMEGTNGGMGAQMGYEIGLTSNYYFYKKPSNFNTGLRITYLSFSSIPFDWKTTGDYIVNKGEFSNLDFLSFKAGIVFRLAVAEKKSFLIFNQVCFTYGWNGAMIYEGTYYIDPYTKVSDHAEMQLNSGSGFRDEIGISFKTGHFVADFGYSFGKIKYNDAEFNRDLYAPGYNPLNAEYKFHPNMPTSTLILSAGFGF